MENLFPFIKSAPKLTGFVSGIFGTLVIGLFVTVVVFGNPAGGHNFDEDREIVYPNW